MIFDSTKCDLGEGPLWHPKRHELFWFDITNNKLLSAKKHWQFDENVSAAGWIDQDNLLIATATALIKFDLESAAQTQICPVEADNQMTRSNDGRADPFGGFWIGTMGVSAQKDAGAIYRYYQGELRQLYAPITIPNAICFCPDGTLAYFADTAKCMVWKQVLGKDGWPKGAPETFLDLRRERLNPDGAVCDTEGFVWIAQWGAARIARYTPEGELDSVRALPTPNITCPAFGGDDMRTLFVTSAMQSLAEDQGDAGKTFFTRAKVSGQKEHRIIL